MDELRERLEKLAAEKSAAELARAEEAARWQKTHLPLVDTFANDEEMREEFELIRDNFIRKDTGYEDELDGAIGAANDDLFWDRFTQLLQARHSIVYGVYAVKNTINESLPDEKNLDCEARHIFIDRKMVVRCYAEALVRMLLAAVRFAKNLNSPFYPRLLELLVTARHLGKMNAHLKPDEATEYAGNLRRHIELLLAERYLLTDDELDKYLADPGSKREDFEDEENAAFSMFDDYDDPEEGTRESKRKIEELYRKQARVLLQPTRRLGENLPPIQILARETKKLATDMKRGEPAEPKDAFPYEMLEDLLKLNTRPLYLKYHLNPQYGDESLPWQPQCEGDPAVVTMPEHEKKEAILKDLQDFLHGGMYIAKRIQSPSLGDWQKAVMFLRQVGEEICRTHPTRRAEAAIHQFCASIRTARAQLWIDLRAIGGKYDFAAENAAPEPMPVKIVSESIDEAAKKIGREMKPKGGRPADPKLRWTYKEIVLLFGLKDEDAVTRWNRGEGAPDGWKAEFVFKKNENALFACVSKYLHSHAKFDALRTRNLVRNVSDQMIKVEARQLDEVASREFDNPD